MKTTEKIPFDIDAAMALLRVAVQPYPPAQLAYLPELPAAGCTAIGAAGATNIGAACGAKATITSSSMNALMADPIGRRALVPVMKKPAIGTTTSAPTTAPVPVTPLSSNWPVRRICRPFARTNRA